MSTRLLRTVPLVVAALGLAACGGGGGNGNDNNQNPPPPPPNTTSVSADLAAGEVAGGSTASGSAAADFTVNLDDDTIGGSVTLTGITASAVSLRQGVAGQVGPELVALTESSATEWTLPAGAAFTADDVADLEAGRLYVQVDTDAAPDGALRAQLVVGNVEVLFADMSGAKEVPPVSSANTARAAITYDPDTGDLAVHLNATGLDDAVAAHVHTGLAGTNGPVTIGLVQDPENVAHWSTEDGVVLTAGQQADFDAGRLYVNLHTPAHQGGEVLAQIEPDGVEVVYTELTAGEVVPPATVAETGTAYVTIVGAERDLAVNVYVGGPADTDAVAIHQAPAGQNGPVVYDLTQDATEPTLWSTSDADVDEGVFTALVNQGLFVQSTSPGFPDGALRGQILTLSSEVPPTDTFLVESTSPPIGMTAAFEPEEVVVNFNRDVLAGTAGAEQFELLAAGGDGTFGDGNELAVNIAATSVASTAVTLDLTGASVDDDTYQLTVNGAADGVTDTSGVLLDGDADGTAGGDFVGSFTVNTAPTFGQVQQVFTQSCALSGCHAGAAPQQGMNLSAGVAYANIVNVPSSEMPSLDRIEPNDPDNSYLIRKIEGTGLQGRMPLGSPPLSPETIQLFRDWVSSGAPNNPEVPGPGGTY